MAAKLKVFRSHIGFYETVVAAPSQKAALDAWGVRQNLFAEGAAEVTDDPDVAKAALASPGVPLKRPAGSKEAFAADPATPSLPKGKAPKKGKPKPDRRDLDAAEAALKALRTQQKEERAALEARRKALETEVHEAEARWGAAREAAEAALKDARKAYRKAGGKA